MSEVTAILEEIERYIAYWERQPESREKDAEDYAVGLFKKTVALLSTHTVNQWISVETELPERGIRVLAYSIKADNSLAYRLIDGAFVYQLCEITHWMPIPSPPEVKT